MLSRISNKFGKRRKEAVSRTVIGIPLTIIAGIAAALVTVVAVGLWVLDLLFMAVLNRQLINPSSPIIRVWNWFRFTAERTLLGSGDRYRLLP